MLKNEKKEIWDEFLKMGPTEAKLEQVYLDPNNPRVEIPKKEPIPEARILEDEIQRDCLEKLKEVGLFDLIGSISNSGFSIVDRVVLRPLKDEKYVVVEGNRRIAALKILAESHRKGHLTLPEKIIKGILKF